MKQAGVMLRFSVLLVLVLCFKDVTGETKKILLKVSLADGPAGDFLGESDVYDMDSEGYPKQISRNSIQGTNQPELFQKQRFSRGQDLMLRVPVPDGVYSVTLLMAEVYEPACAPGARVFNIALGTPHSGLTQVANNFDLFANAGCATAYGKRFDGIVSKDGIVVRLGHVKQHPTLAGYIVEGYPVPKADGSEYRAIAQAPAERAGEASGLADAGLSGVSGAGDPASLPAAGLNDGPAEGLGAGQALTGRMGEPPSEPAAEPSALSSEGPPPSLAEGPEGSTLQGGLEPQTPFGGENMASEPVGMQGMQAQPRRRLLTKGHNGRRRDTSSKTRHGLRGASLKTHSRLSLQRPKHS